MICIRQVSRAILVAFPILLPAVVAADEGFYLGIGAGGASLEAEVSSNALTTFDVDEDDSAFKLFGGYVWSLSQLELGVEVAYTDFGEPEIDLAGQELQLATTGISAFGLAAYDLGPIDVFAKAGVVQWETESSLAGLSVTTDDTDLAYGVGIRVGVGRFDLRGELELFDLGDGDLSMLSLGLSYRF